MSYTVLIVDDSPVIHSVLKKSIGMSGLDVGKVLDAANGREALGILEKEWVDIVLTDIHMPDMDGIELVRRLSANDLLRSLPVVVVSSDRNQAQIECLKEQGVRAFLRKPVSPEDLRAVVQSVLSKGRDET